MRHLSLLLLVLALGCETTTTDDVGTQDAGTDAPRADAGPPVLEPFAALGSTSEGLALGSFEGTPSIFVGLTDGRIVRVTPDGEVHDFVSIEGPLGMTVRASGELVVCAATDEDVPGVFQVAMDGTITPLVLEDPDGAAFGLTNNVTIAPDGSLVFTDSNAHAVYRADADGSNVALVTDAFTYPNGLAFLDDTLYVASWDTTTLYAMSYSAGTYGAPSAAIEGIAAIDGVIASGTSLVLITSGTGGLRVDPALPSAEPISLFSRHLLSLPANGVFGDAAFGTSELFVTSLAQQNLYVVHTGS
jgi:sugar lactone lactonase YvrE